MPKFAKCNGAFRIRQKNAFTETTPWCEEPTPQTRQESTAQGQESAGTQTRQETRAQSQESAGTQRHETRAQINFHTNNPKYSL